MTQKRTIEIMIFCRRMLLEIVRPFNSNRLSENGPLFTHETFDFCSYLLEEGCIKNIFERKIAYLNLCLNFCIKSSCWFCKSSTSTYPNWQSFDRMNFFKYLSSSSSLRTIISWIVNFRIIIWKNVIIWFKFIEWDWIVSFIRNFWFLAHNCR